MTKTRITFYLPVSTVDKAKDAVFWTPGMTLSGLTERALSKYIDEMESDRGEVFPPREAEPAKGRPAK